MLFPKGSGRRRIAIAALVLALHSFSNSIIQAQEPRVVPGQYLLMPDPASAEHPYSLALSMDEQVLASADGTLLVQDQSTPTIAYLSSSSGLEQSQPYDQVQEALFCKRYPQYLCGANLIVNVDATPNDPELSREWGMSASSGINASAAWQHTTGSSSVVVAVIDTGVDYRHPDIAANMWVNNQEIPGNGRDDDNNGYVDDVYGINAIDSSGNPLDDNGHGTHVAGTIGAVGNNGIGVVGVNWQVKIMALKFLSASGSGSLFGAIKALQYATKMKQRGVNVRMSNNSWGGSSYSQPLEAAVTEAAEAGLLFVAAAGNNGSDNDLSSSYPANFEGTHVISVAALDQQGNLASFSNYGERSVDIAAPGVGILSLAPDNKYRSLSGTSMATPHVTGALALLLAKDPNLTNAQLVNRLYETGRQRSSLSGVIRTERSLDAARLITGETTPLPDPDSTRPKCSYTTEAIPYIESQPVTGTAVVSRGDELTFYTLDLPFEFPFFGKSYQQVIVSPNGVVYVGSSPQGMDYRNSSTAAPSTIAVLHSDWISEVEPEGVRVAVGSDEATIHWTKRNYAYRQLGTSQFSLTLKADGSIQQQLTLPDPTVAAHLASSATIGIRGSAADELLTVAYKSPMIADRLAFKYIPHCEAPPALEVKSISVKGQVDGRVVEYLREGRRFSVSLGGTGSGTTTVQIGFDQSVCSESINLPILNGSGEKKATFRLPSRFPAQRFYAVAPNEGLLTSASVKRIRRSAKGSALSRPVRKNSSAYQRLFKQACSSLARGLR